MKSEPILRNMAVKVLAFILFVITACTLVASIVAIGVRLSGDVKLSNKNEMLKEQISDLAHSAADDVARIYRSSGEEGVKDYSSGSNATYKVTKVTADTETLYSGRETSDNYIFTTPVELYKLNYEPYSESGSVSQDELLDDMEYYEVVTTIDKDFTYNDIYSNYSDIFSIVNPFISSSYVTFAISIILFVLLFVFLMCSAGHRTGHEEIIGGPFYSIPFDLLTAGIIFISYWVFAAIFESSYPNGLVEVYLFSVGVALGFVVATGWCMSLAVRIKKHELIKKTFIYRVINFIWRILKLIGSAFKTVFSNLPVIWKTAVIVSGISLIELICIGVTWWETDNYLILWILGRLILIPAILYIAIILRRLKTCGEKLANGDLSYQVDTKHMYWDFKEHGENLNSIAMGMTKAVDERMKSEHLKTELITNVSHDIKTPLTSIINYADLIGKENCDNEKISEYIEVLSRQSERLKKLIEDLVEASKASTGNIEVHLQPCDAGVLLEQAAGEYQQRFNESSLELILNRPEEPIQIMADGRLLWRVFDNLMNNIRKYAQPNTRVYLNLEVIDGESVFSFKNISKYPLNISSDELMERFVRGDKSRNTEGSGLGLSIAKSLTELQYGTFDVVIDGDLFKVTLKFNVNTK